MGISFTLHQGPVKWATAKSKCEAAGQRLAVLDTEDKLSALKEQVWVLMIYVQCNNEILYQNIFKVFECVSVLYLARPWIGFRDLNDNDSFVWLNGNPLSNGDENWSGSKYSVWYLPLNVNNTLCNLTYETGGMSQ